MALTCDEISALVTADHAEKVRAERGSMDAATQAIELAYGLLWIVGCDRSTKDGNALYLARKALYERLDKTGQARGIIAAREALDNSPTVHECPTCFRTDRQYKLGRERGHHGLCRDPWHADDHLRGKTA